MKKKFILRGIGILVHIVLISVLFITFQKMSLAEAFQLLLVAGCTAIVLTMSILMTDKNEVAKKKKFDWTLIGVVLISVIFSAIIVFPTSPLPFGEKIKLTLIPMAFLVGLYILGRWSAKIMNKKESN